MKGFTLSSPSYSTKLSCPNFSQCMIDMSYRRYDIVHASVHFQNRRSRAVQYVEEARVALSYTAVSMTMHARE